MTIQRDLRSNEVLTRSPGGPFGPGGPSVPVKPCKKTQKIKRMPSCQQHSSKSFSYSSIQPGVASPSTSPDMQDTDAGPGLTILLQQAQRRFIETNHENIPAYVQDLKDLRDKDKILTSTPGRPGNPASPAAPGFPGVPFGPYMR